MGRWRAPQPRSSPYITPEGFDRLQSELAALWPRRRQVTAALAAAAAEGDRSENAEYIYRKKELREILQKRLPELTVVRTVASPDQVFFGAWIRLEKADGSEVEYRIVGADELDPGRNHVSVDSPLGRALLKKTVGDEVELVLGERSEWFLVNAIRYRGPAG